jgi:dienelactone hydrolase
MRRLPPSALIGLALAGLAAPFWSGRDGASAAERVQFESARYLVGPLQQRLARERGETIVRPADIIDGYVTRPAGDGPFPALVYLHGCNGLPGAFKRGEIKGLWSERLAAWGYVVLVVDSFTTRGIDNTCAGEPAPRVADAYGALAYLAHQTFVDARHIGIIGFSAGGIATLSAVEQHDAVLFEHEGEQTFKAAVAFYPVCASDGPSSIPTLILIGDRDDWSPADLCRRSTAKRAAAGSPVRLIVYPGAFHAFDVTTLQPGRRYFGHWVEYNAAAADAAAAEVRTFLAEQLGR